MFLETILGSKAKLKLLRVLAETRTAFTLQELKSETELSIGIIHRSLQDLVQEGIVRKLKGSGKERLFAFDAESRIAHPVFELFRTEKTLRRKEVVLLHTWNVLESAVAKLRERSHLIALFGSQARGHATMRSDIDLLIIPKGSPEEITAALSTVKSRNKINPSVLSLSAFQDERRENTLFYRNIKSDALILCLEPEIRNELRPFLEDISYNERGAVEHG